MKHPLDDRGVALDKQHRLERKQQPIECNQCAEPFPGAPFAAVEHGGIGDEWRRQIGGEQWSHENQLQEHENGERQCDRTRETPAPAQWQHKQYGHHHPKGAGCRGEVVAGDLQLHAARNRHDDGGRHSDENRVGEHIMVLGPM